MPAIQLNSLPLFTAQAAATGGTVSLGLGGGLTRFWDPVTLGISAVNFAADANGFIVLLSNFISVFGCRSFALILRRTNVGVGLALSPLEVRIQYRISAADVPATSFGAATQDVQYTGSVTAQPGGTGVIFPLMEAAGEDQRALVCWDSSSIANGGAPNGTVAMIGDQVRLFLNIGSGGLPAGGNLFSAYLWGTS
jgi:hypothetical protein